MQKVIYQYFYSLILTVAFTPPSCVLKRGPSNLGKDLLLSHTESELLGLLEVDQNTLSIKTSTRQGSSSRVSP
jgi:hypothetical protein